MRKASISATLIAVVLMAALSPLSASAREGGARSIGNGVKCYTAGVLQANGTVKYERVCRKGV